MQKACTSIFKFINKYQWQALKMRKAYLYMLSNACLGAKPDFIASFESKFYTEISWYSGLDREVLIYQND